MKRIIRDRHLTPKEAEKYRAIRQEIDQEMPELVREHWERLAARERLQKLCEQLKAAREAKGLSLTELTEITGMDRSAISKLENGQRANPTVETLARYAEAVGKNLVIRLVDAPR